MRSTYVRCAAAFILLGGAVALLDCGSDRAAIGNDDAGSDGGTSGDAADGGLLPMDAAIDQVLPTEAAAGDAADSGCIPSACASGACLPDGGACVPTCSVANPCGGTLTCCLLKCVDTARDPKNCGSCGNACTASQFCSSTACEETIFQNVCKSPRGVIISDGIAADDNAGIALNTSLAATCTMTTRIVTQATAESDGGILTDAGKPILGAGEMVVPPGGSFRQDAVAYMQTSNTPIYDTQVGTVLSLVRRSNGNNIVQVQDSTITTHHDYFVLQLATEPTSGTLCLLSYGFLGEGTAAAAYYLSTTVLPNRATFTDSWYVYEWTDGVSQDALPDATDTFALIASGK